jgi:hypothetical protein
MWGIIVTGIIQLSIMFGMFTFGIFPMLTAYLSINFLGLLYWHYNTNKLIGLKIIHVVKDISPYLIVSIISILIAWIITSKIDNIVLRFILKIIITAIIYILTIWKTNSVILKDSFFFIKSKIFNKK